LAAQFSDDVLQQLLSNCGLVSGALCISFHPRSRAAGRPREARFDELDRNWQPVRIRDDPNILAVYTNWSPKEFFV
jgi:hypothetical protein